METWRWIWRELWPGEKSFDDKPGETPKCGYWGIRAWQLLVLIVGILLGLGAGCLLRGIIEEPTYRKFCTILLGLEITLVLGLLSSWWLETYVWVPYPNEWKELNYERKGGGAFLGFLERLIFFAAFWHSALLAGAWLAFKLGAKWGVWQHVIKYPGTGYIGDMQKREQLGSRVLGRFLNGTLWNLVCGLIGATVTKALWLYLDLNPSAADVLWEILEAAKWR